MSTITVSPKDIKDADQFLTAYLQEQVPDADFSEGTAIRDLVIGSMAYLFAFLRKEIKAVSDHQSLLRLANLPPSTDVDEAVDAYLSNWFITRKDGNPARVPAALHFSQATEVLLTPTTVFRRNANAAFVPDIQENVVIPSSELNLRVNERGVNEYVLNLTLVATENGVSGNVPAGRFTNVDTFNPYFTYGEVVSAGTDGKDPETTEELLSRAPTAITTRNLINQRSISTVLREEFNQLKSVLTVGFGDPEMTRDLVTESVTRLHMHVGGHDDIYVGLNRTEVVESNLVIGAPYARPDNVINIFRDEAEDFSSINPGDVLRLYDEDGTQEYIITGVSTHELEVTPRKPFPIASDEVGTTYQYSIGTIAPSFSDKRGLLTSEGETSRKIREPNMVLLAGRPHYRINKVEVVDGTEVTVLDLRVNRSPDIGEYQVVCKNPASAQSRLDTTAIYVNSAYAGKTLRVVYETLVGYDDIQSFVTDPFERTVCGSTLVKGYNPVYVKTNLHLRTRKALTQADRDSISTSVADAINTLERGEVLDVSYLNQHVRNNFPYVVAILEPLAITYDLIAPDGQVYTYTTSDQVTLFPGSDNAAKLTNGGELRDTSTSLTKQLSSMGVSDRTVQYFCQPSDVMVA